VNPRVEVVEPVTIKEPVIIADPVYGNDAPPPPPFKAKDAVKAYEAEVTLPNKNEAVAA
jgi:hypothetical protein